MGFADVIEDVLRASANSDELAPLGSVASLPTKIDGRSG